MSKTSVSFFFWMFVALSTERKNDAGFFLQQLIQKTAQETFQKYVDSTEKRLQAEKEMLQARENRLQENQTEFYMQKEIAENFRKLKQSTQADYREQEEFEKKMRAVEDKFQYRLKQNELQESSQKLNKLEETLRKREQSIDAAEQRLNVRDEKFRKKQNSLSAQKNIRKEQCLAECEKPKENFRMALKIIVLFNMFPNESSIQVYRDMKTNYICWDDPNGLVPIAIKEDIEFCLEQRGETMANSLFHCISSWRDVPVEAKSFVLELTFAMSQSVDVQIRSEFNLTALMFAAIFDDERGVSKLIDRGVEIDAVDDDGHSAIQYAAWYGNESCCRVLLQRDADANAQNKFGTTALMLASDVGVVKLLLQSGADTECTDSNGKTASQIASKTCADVIRAHEANCFPKFEMLQKKLENLD